MSEWKQIGVKIRQGPANWQIVQQRHGAADIRLAGTWHYEGSTANRPQVYGRAVNEADGTEVAGWTAFAMDEDDGWEGTLRDIPAGGLYRIETCLAVDEHTVSNWPYRGDIVHHVGVGDLWIIAGQSNAAGFGRGPLHDPPELGIHLLRESGAWDIASHPFNESTGTMHREVYESCNTGHSPFLAFGRAVKREVGYPIGFVMAAQGGAPLKDWHPDGGLIDLKLRRAVKLAGGAATGVLWYQGESDTGTSEDATSYMDRFAEIVGSWRALLGQPQLPVLTVQLNRYYQSPEQEGTWNRKWGIVREQQRKAALEIPGVTVVSSLDCPFSDQIHNGPAGNALIGERLAKAALGFVYGRKTAYLAPNIEAARRDGGDSRKVILSFGQVTGPLVNIGLYEKPFKVEDESGEIEVAGWSVGGSAEIVLSLARSPGQGAVVHGASEVNPSAILPIDSATFQPMLAFYGFEIR